LLLHSCFHSFGLSPHLFSLSSSLRTSWNKSRHNLVLFQLAIDSRNKKGIKWHGSQRICTRKEQLGNKILKMIHSTPLKIKINKHQITSIFELQSISNSHFRNFFLSFSLSLFFFITMQQHKGQSKTKWNSNLEITDMEIKGRIQIWKLQF